MYKVELNPFVGEKNLPNTTKGPPFRSPPPPPTLNPKPLPLQGSIPPWVCRGGWGGGGGGVGGGVMLPSSGNTVDG